MGQRLLETSHLSLSGKTWKEVIQWPGKDVLPFQFSVVRGIKKFQNWSTKDQSSDTNLKLLTFCSLLGSYKHNCWAPMEKPAETTCNLFCFSKSCVLPWHTTWVWTWEQLPMSMQLRKSSKCTMRLVWPLHKQATTAPCCIPPLAVNVPSSWESLSQVYM